MLNAFRIVGAASRSDFCELDRIVNGKFPSITAIDRLVMNPPQEIRPGTNRQCPDKDVRLFILF